MSGGVDVLLLHDANETSQDVELGECLGLWHAVRVLRLFTDLLGDFKGFATGVDVVLFQGEWQERSLWSILHVGAVLVELLTRVGVARFG